MRERICPDCKISLRPVQSGAVEIDVCPACEGVWFDPGEFDALIGQRYAGRGVESGAAQSTFLQLDGKPCPESHPHMLGLDFDGIELAMCRPCRGIWVDAPARAAISKRPVVAHRAPATVDTTVTCENCEDVVERTDAVHCEDAFWCKACVLNGEYPGARNANARALLAGAQIRQKHRALMIQDRRARNRSMHSPIERLVWDLFRFIDDVRKDTWFW